MEYGLKSLGGYEGAQGRGGSKSLRKEGGDQWKREYLGLEVGGRLVVGVYLCLLVDGEGRKGDIAGVSKSPIGVGGAHGWRCI